MSHDSSIGFWQNSSARMSAKLLSLSVSVVIAIGVGMTGVVEAAPPPVIAERLTPPKSVELPPLAPTTRQSVAPLRGVENPPRHQWPLPSGPISRNSPVLKQESTARRVQIPTLDVPPLAHEAVPTLPVTIRLLEVPGGRVFGPNGTASPPLGRFARDKEPLPIPSDDATAEANLAHLVRPAAVAAAQPAPPLPIGIPDPDAALRAVRYDGVLLEPEAPSVSRELPLRPRLGDK